MKSRLRPLLSGLFLALFVAGSCYLAFDFGGIWGLVGMIVFFFGQWQIERMRERRRKRDDERRRKEALSSSAITEAEHG